MGSFSFAVMPLTPIFEKKGFNHKMKATAFGDEHGETEGRNKEPRRLYSIERFRKISSIICLGYPQWIKRSKHKSMGSIPSQNPHAFAFRIIFRIGVCLTQIPRFQIKFPMRITHFCWLYLPVYQNLSHWLPLITPGVIVNCIELPSISMNAPRIFYAYIDEFIDQQA
jgi:hypothetical protein